MTEATEAPATDRMDADPLGPDSGGMDSDRIDEAAAAFRRQLEGHVSVSASVVQDGLLDLWGLLPEGDRRAVIEQWLTETLGRNLYSVSDVDSRLDAVLSTQN